MFREQYFIALSISSFGDKASRWQAGTTLSFFIFLSISSAIERTFV